MSVAITEIKAAWTMEGVVQTDAFNPRVLDKSSEIGDKAERTEESVIPQYGIIFSAVNLDLPATGGGEG